MSSESLVKVQDLTPEKRARDTSGPNVSSPCSDVSTCATTPKDGSQSVFSMPIAEEPVGRSPSDGSVPFLERLDAVATPREEGPEGLRAKQPVYRSSFFIVLPTFAGYAALFGLQHEVKKYFNIADDKSTLSHEFSTATSFLYIFNLIFRFMHNVVFGCMSSRSRVYAAMTALATSMLILTLLTTRILTPRIPYIVVAYALGGVGIGSFESNLLSTLTCHGHATKKWATCAIPVGISSVLVGSFFLLNFGLPVSSIYVSVAAGLGVGMLIMHFCIPAHGVADLQLPAPCASPAPAPTQGFRLVADIRGWREWLPCMWSLPIAMAVNMFCLSTFAPGVLPFIYDQPEVAMLSPPVVGHTVTMRKDLFMVVYNLATAVGGFAARYAAYNVRRVLHPLCFTTFSAAGIILVILSTPGHLLAPMGGALAPVGGILIFLGDGFIYNTISRSIDERVPKAYNLAALSCWLFVGDFGSIAGSNLIAYIRDWLVV